MLLIRSPVTFAARLTLAGAVLGCALPSRAQGPTQLAAPVEPVAPAVQGEQVVEVRIEGNRAISKARILNQIQTRAGRPFRKEIVEQDVRHLAQRGWFIDVRPFYQQVPGGRVVIFQVTERPVLRYVQYLGNEYVKDRHLAKETGLKVGDALDPYAIDEGRRKITEYYQERGYNRVRVTVLEGNKPSDQGAVYLIHEGKSQRIWRVSFVGNTIASDARLKTQIQSKPGFLWLFQGQVDRGKIEADLQRLTAYYRSLGFFRARVGRQLRFNDDGSWLTLVFVIDEGPRYKIRDVSFIGNRKFSSEQLGGQLDLESGEYFNQSEMNHDVGLLRDIYGSQGYVFADINASPRTDETEPEIDLVYEIDEGRQYRVGQIRVHIQGDYPHTRRQAVLNRISLRPGDIVDVRELRRSERLLRASSIFENNPATGQAPRIVFSPPGTEPPPVTRRRRNPAGNRGGPPIVPGGGGGSGFRGQSPDPRRRERTTSKQSERASSDAYEGGVLVPRVRRDGSIIDFDYYPAEAVPNRAEDVPRKPDGKPRTGASGESTQPRNVRRPIVRGQSPGFGGYPVYSPGPSDGLNGTGSPAPGSGSYGVGAGQPSYPNPAYGTPAGTAGSNPAAASSYGTAAGAGASDNRSAPRSNPYAGNATQPAPSSSYGSGSTAARAPAYPASPQRQAQPTQPQQPPQSPPSGSYPQSNASRSETRGTYSPSNAQPAVQPNSNAAAPRTRFTQQPGTYGAQDGGFASPGGTTVNPQGSFGSGFQNPPAGAPGAVGSPPGGGTGFSPFAGPGGVPPGAESVPPGPGFPAFPQSGAPVIPPQERYPLLPFDVYVDETQTGRFMLGVGVNSDAGVVGSITVDERNFDILRFPRSFEDFRNGTAWRGAGQRFRLEALPGSEVQRYLVSFQEPYLFDTAISFGLSGFFFDRRFREWDEQRLGGRLTLGYQLTPDLSASVAYRGEEVNIHDAISPRPPELDEALGQNTLHGFKTTLVHDTRDSAFLATEGHYLSMSFEQVIGTFDYPRAELDARRYFLVQQRPDGSGRHVVSLTTRVGFSGSQTPIYDHFFIGGFSTLRGFDFRGAGPFKSGVFVGGEFMWTASLEYLLPITANDMLRAVAFVDAGTVAEDVEIDKFRVAPGVGLRITVPALGPAPIALDFAFPVVEEPTDREQVFSFNIGFLR